MSSNQTPTVSVCMITYNHEPFIAQAIEGVLMQETDFPVELVIGEDCSTDGTRAICEEYAEKYPGKIRLLTRTENIGIIPNFVATITECSGQFMAFCEGDDYWIDQHKLQKQVEFLEANSDFSTCFHDSWINYGGSKNQEKLTASARKDELTFDDMVWRRVPIGTASILSRSEVLRAIPDDFLLYDWVIHLFAAHHGRVKYFDDVMSVYRKHPDGWTNFFSVAKARDFLTMTKQCEAYFAPKGEESFRFWIGHCYADVCFANYQAGNKTEFIHWYNECRKTCWGVLSARKKFSLRLRRALLSLQ